MSLGRIAKSIMPPLLFQAAVRAKKSITKSVPDYEYLPDGWRETVGWNAESVLASNKSRWPDVVRSLQGTGPLNITTDRNDLAGHNIMMSFCYALARTAAGQSSISVLDWGGGIGHYALISEAALPEVSVEYHCKDLPILAEYGKSLVPHARFYMDDSCLERTYDLVLASSSLQYSQQWQETLSGLAHATGKYLFLTRSPIHRGSRSFVFLQRSYGSEWSGWSLNYNELLDFAQSQGLELLREFVMFGEPMPIVNSPETVDQRGFLFRKMHP